jgi:hypothetical protein
MPEANRFNKSQGQTNDEGIASLGKPPRTKIFATKEIKLTNKLIFNLLPTYSMIGYNMAIVNGGLIKFRAFEGIEYFDQYVEKLLSNTCQTIGSEIDACDTYLDAYKMSGYSFIVDSEQSSSTLKLLNASSNNLITLFEKLDELLTKINYLEKCNHYSSTQKIMLERQWVDLPKLINSRVLNVHRELEKGFSIKLRDANHNNTSIDRDKLKQMLTKIQKNRSNINTVSFLPIPDGPNQMSKSVETVTDDVLDFTAK